MTEFHLLRPWWLIALLPLALFYWRLLFMQKNRSGWHQWLPPHLSQALVASSNKARPWSAHRLALFWLISTLALSGPTWERLPQPVYQLETGQVVIMDMSPSMSAQDLEPNRLTRLRFKAMDLVKAGLDGDTGLIAYANDAFTISPLTADNNNLLSLIPSLSPQIMPVAGSEPLRALKLADELLSNAGYAEGDIYWLTDGISTQDQLPLTNYLRQQPHRVSILGVGTKEGAPIRDADGALQRDRYGQVVVAKLNDGRLQDLAALSGGLYQQITADNQDVATLVAQPPLTREGKDSEQQQQGDQWQDRGPFLALLLIPLVLFSWRRGGTLGQWLWLGLLPLFMAPVPVNAQSQTQQADAGAWWQNAEQRAQAAYQDEHYQAAAELTADPMMRGAAQYRAGDYQAAADSFAQRDSAASWYNRGNALAQQQQFSAAYDAYQQALDKRPDWPEAQDNAELMQQLQQQQQQQGNNGENGEQNRDQQSDNQQDGERENNSDANNESEGNTSDSQQTESSSQPKEPEQQANEQQSDASEEAQVQQSEMQTQQSSDPQSAEQQQRNQQTQFSDDIDPEKAQQLEQWMKRIPDDPSILLRNKMLLESQRRNQNRASQPQGVKKKW